MEKVINWYEKKIGDEWYGFRRYRYGAFVCLLGGGFDYAYKQGAMSFKSFMDAFKPGVNGSMPAMVGDWIQIDLFK